MGTDCWLNRNGAPHFTQRIRVSFSPPHSFSYERSKNCVFRFSRLIRALCNGNWRVSPWKSLVRSSARLTEFEQEQIDPLTGKSMVDPRTGFARCARRTCLVESFGLPVVSHGTLDASRAKKKPCARFDANRAMASRFRAPICWRQAPHRPEAGRSAIDRSFWSAIISCRRSDTADSVIVRIAGMADALPVGGVTVRAVTAENIELQRTTTDQNGYSNVFPGRTFP